MTVASCSYLDAAREEMNERGVECRYNKRKIVDIWIDNLSYIEGDDLYEKVNSVDVTSISTGCKLFIF